MEPDVYDVEADVLEAHWWFRGRRRLFAREIRLAKISPWARTLDIGTGTGSNLLALRDLDFRHVYGLEPNLRAITACRQRGFANLVCGDALTIPFPSETFGLVLLTDVIEHLEDDRAGLLEAWRVLRVGGRLLLTVPTFMSLWGVQDELSHHRRRYRLPQLLNLVQGVPLAVERAFYFNYLLFAPIWLARQAVRRLGIRLRSENEVNSPSVNAILTRVFALDVDTAPLLRPCFGVSAFVLVRKIAA